MSNLDNETQLGLHLAPGTSDGYLTSANYIKDPENDISVQERLNKIENGGGGA